MTNEIKGFLKDLNVDRPFGFHGCHLDALFLFSFMWKTSHLWDQQKCWPGSDWVTVLSLVCICWLAPQIPSIYVSIKGNLIRLQAPTVIQSTLLPVLGWHTKICLAHSLFKKSGLGGKLELDPKCLEIKKKTYFAYFSFSMWKLHQLFLHRICICFVHLFFIFWWQTRVTETQR